MRPLSSDLTSRNGSNRNISGMDMRHYARRSHSFPNEFDATMDSTARLTASSLHATGSITKPPLLDAIRTQTNETIHRETRASKNDLIKLRQTLYATDQEGLSLQKSLEKLKVAMDEPNRNLFLANASLRKRNQRSKNVTDEATSALKKERREAAALRSQLGDQLLKTQRHLHAIREVRHKLSRDAKTKGQSVSLNTESFSSQTLRKAALPSRVDPVPNNIGNSVELIRRSQNLRIENLSLLQSAERSQAEIKRAVNDALKQSARKYRDMESDLTMSKARARIARNAAERQNWLSMTANEINKGPESSKDMKTFEKRNRPLIKIHDRDPSHRPGSVSKLEDGVVGTRGFEESIRTTGLLSQELRTTSTELDAYKHDYSKTAAIDQEVLRMRNRYRRTQWPK